MRQRESFLGVWSYRRTPSFTGRFDAINGSLDHREGRACTTGSTRPDAYNAPLHPCDMLKVMRHMKILVGGILLATSVSVVFGANAESQPLVKYKGISISASDVDQELGLLPPKKREKVIADDNNLQSTVTGLYFRKRMSQLAESQGMLADTEVQAALKQAREATLAKIVTDSFLEDLDYPSFDEEARAYYQEHQDEFTPPEQIRASHIFLQAPKKEDKKRRRSEAEKILKQLRKGGSFAELAKAHSEDSSKHMGGDLGYFTRERMAPEFNEVAFSMEEKGEISGIVETRFGLHIIKLLDRKEPDAKSFEDVSGQIKQRLRAEYRQEQFSAWLKQQVPPDVVGLSAERLETLQAAMAERFDVSVPDEEAAAPADSENATVEPADAVTQP